MLVLGRSFAYCLWTVRSPHQVPRFHWRSLVTGEESTKAAKDRTGLTTAGEYSDAVSVVWPDNSEDNELK